MAEINKIEIDGVEYTITAPREVIYYNAERQDIQPTIETNVEENVAYFNNLDNKYLIIDINYLFQNMEDRDWYYITMNNCRNSKVYFETSTLKYNALKTNNRMNVNVDCKVQDNLTFEGWNYVDDSCVIFYNQEYEIIVCFTAEFDEIGICDVKISRNYET